MMKPRSALYTLRNLPRIFPESIEATANRLDPTKTFDVKIGGEAVGRYHVVDEIEPPKLEMLYADMKITGRVVVVIDEHATGIDRPSVLDVKDSYRFVDCTLSEVMSAASKMWEWPELDFIGKHENLYHIISVDFDLRLAEPEIEFVIGKYDPEAAEDAMDSWNKRLVEEHINVPSRHGFTAHDFKYQCRLVKDDTERYYHPLTVFSYGDTLKEAELECLGSHDEFVALLVSRLYLPKNHQLHPDYGIHAFSTLYYEKN